MKKYYTNWQLIILLIVAALSLWIVGEYLQAQETIYSQTTFWKGILIAVVPIGFGLLLATKYTYVTITDTELKIVNFLFYRRTLDISSITEINDQPTFKMAKGSFRSLYIFYKNKEGEIKWIELRITIYPEKTLGKLIKDLKQINPDIKLNTYSEKLMGMA